MKTGYVLSEDYRGKGLMTETVQRTIRILFEETDIEAVTGSHYISNHRSEGVIRKCGFGLRKKANIIRYK